MDIIALSRCLREVKSGSYWVFHFKGFMRGDDIKKMHLTSDLPLELGEDYILHIKVVRVENKILFGQVLKAKCLRDILIE